MKSFLLSYPGMRALCFGSLVVLSGCVSGPREDVTIENTPCRGKIREAIEFFSTTVETRMFFTDYVSDAGMMSDDPMQIFYDTLGVNVSSVLLSMKEPYSHQISLRLNSDMDAFVKAVNRRVFSGGSLVEMQDVVGMVTEGEFMKVTIDSPNIVSGVLFVRCEPIEGREVAEQTFVDFTAEDGVSRKLSVSALKGLIE
ncbi:MAG: hypothetical protein PF795_04560 [Kiritimatiellae bacterium]|jgi:hypothetical protein|nr:hypothetical protein [Kiritimatiellia bacterium]